VLVHGLASSIYTWAEVLPRLAERYDVVAVDLPGFGGSDIPARLDTATVGRLLPEVMDALGLARASLAGNSLGGALAAVTAARHPDRVDRLVLLDAAAYNFALADRPPLLRLAGRLPGWLLDAIPQRPLTRTGLKQVYYDDAKVTPERVEEYLAPMARPGAQAAARRLLRDGDGFGLPGVLRQVRAPTLVIWGGEDTWIPVRDADRFLRDIPGARKVILERCGHVPQEEKPAEVARLIAEFLAEGSR
jgi:pimeloyl-ACP methyl ester carboxylesterase